MNEYSGFINLIFDEFAMNECLENRYQEGLEKGRKEREQYLLKLLDQNLSKDEIKQRLIQNC